MLRVETVTRVGGFEVHQLSDGTFRLDGGAMFGVVPKTLWCRSNPADERNRIALALGCLLLRTPSGRNVLVDTGLSSKYDRNRKFRDIYRVERSVTLAERVRSMGTDPDDISLVINTHLHFDHAGGNTEFDARGRPVPQFSGAKYLIQKEEWADAGAPHERNQASYLPENFEPLDRAGAVELVDGDYEVEPGLKVLRSGGHTRGHQCVLIESEGRAALFLGDIVPTRSHVPLPYIMGYDLYPATTLEVKRRLLQSALEQKWLLLFQHDPGQRSGFLQGTDGRWTLSPSGA